MKREKLRPGFIVGQLLIPVQNLEPALAEQSNVMKPVKALSERGPAQSLASGEDRHRFGSRGRFAGARGRHQRVPQGLHEGIARRVEAPRPRVAFGADVEVGSDRLAHSLGEPPQQVIPQILVAETAQLGHCRLAPSAPGAAPYHWRRGPTGCSIIDTAPPVTETVGREATNHGGNHRCPASDTASRTPLSLLEQLRANEAAAWQRFVELHGQNPDW